MLFWDPRRVRYFLFLTLTAFQFISTTTVGQVIYESASPMAEKGDFNIFEEDKKLGIKNGKGETIVSPQFKKIRLNKDNTVDGLAFTDWLVVDGNNDLIEKINFDTLQPLDENLIKVSLGDLQALADHQGNLLTPLNSRAIYSFNANHALVKENDKYGIINGAGKLVVPIKYDTLLLGKEYLVGEIKKGKNESQWQALHYNGEILFQKDVEQLNVANQGYFAFREHSSWGFYNYQGNKVIPNQYDNVEPFIEGRAIARYLESDGVINRNGKWLIMPRKDKLTHIQNENYLFDSKDERGIINATSGEVFQTKHELIPLNYGFIEKTKEGKVGLISPEGYRLLLTEYDHISALQNDTVYFFSKDDHWGIITKHGKIKLNLKNPIQEMYPMGDIFIGVKIDNKYGFVDINGDLRIANQYEAIGDFSEDMAAVKLRGKWGFVDRIERLQVQPLYDDVFPFKNGTAIVIKGNRYGLVNKHGELILDTTYDSLYREPSGRFISFKDDNKGLVDTDGKILVHPKYDLLKDLDNGYVVISRNKKYGLLTTNGISTIPLVYDSLIYNPYNDLYYASKRTSWKKLALKSDDTALNKK